MVADVRDYSDAQCHAGRADSHYRGQANTSAVLVGVDSLPAPDFTLNVKFK